MQSAPDHGKQMCTWPTSLSVINLSCPSVGLMGQLFCKKMSNRVCFYCLSLYDLYQEHSLDAPFLFCSIRQNLKLKKVCHQGRPKVIF